MRGTTNKVRIDEDQYDDNFLSKFESKEKKRLDLNVLLERKKSEKNVDKKRNILIFFGAVSIASIFFLIIGF